MDTVRDLGRSEPWEESLERSRARRSEAAHAAAKRDQRRPAQRPPRKTSRPRSTTARPRTRRATATRARLRVVGLFAIALAVVAVVSPFAGQSAQRPPLAAQARTMSALAQAPSADSHGAGPLARWPLSGVVEAGLTRTCHPTSGASDYVNPLDRARVRPERIDQGVDYAGSGALAAIGRGTVTYVATTSTGWPGAFIEYRLLDGLDAGCYVYYAEGVNPAAGLRAGETVVAGQQIASLIPGWPTGIEIGWGAGVSTATYAAETHQWSATSDQDSVPSAAGKSFSALLASLGGPPGKVEG